MPRTHLFSHTDMRPDERVPMRVSVWVRRCLTSALVAVSSVLLGLLSASSASAASVQLNPNVFFFDATPTNHSGALSAAGGAEPGGVACYHFADTRASGGVLHGHLSRNTVARDTLRNAGTLTASSAANRISRKYA
jgi:hypothetical protein